MFIRLLCLFALCACAPSDRLQRHYVDHTSLWQTISQDAEIFRDGKDHISVRAVILDNGAGVAGYFLSLSVLRGGPNGPVIERITTHGAPVDYVRHDRRAEWCVDHCHKVEIGAITLSRAAFFDAARDGLPLFIEGRRRNYAATVPAHIFADVIRAAYSTTNLR